MRTVTGLSHQPFATAAALAATALVPEALVSPAPRSQTPTVSSCSPSTRTSWTFVRSRKRSWCSTSGPSRSSSPRSGSRRTTACGLPTETAVSSTCSLPTSIVSVSPTSTLADPLSTSPSSRIVGRPQRAADDDPHLVAPPRRAQPARRDAACRCRTTRRPSRPGSRSRSRQCAVRGDDLEDPVRADAVAVVADPLHPLGRQRRRPASPLDEQVARCRARAISESSSGLGHATKLETISCATSAGGRLPSIMTPGIAASTCAGRRRSGASRSRISIASLTRQLGDVGQAVDRAAVGEIGPASARRTSSSTRARTSSACAARSAGRAPRPEPRGRRSASGAASRHSRAGPRPAAGSTRPRPARARAPRVGGRSRAPPPRPRVALGQQLVHAFRRHARRRGAPGATWRRPGPRPQLDLVSAAWNQSIGGSGLWSQLRSPTSSCRRRAGRRQALGASLRPPWRRDGTRDPRPRRRRARERPPPRRARARARRGRDRACARAKTASGAARRGTRR